MDLNAVVIANDKEQMNGKLYPYILHADQSSCNRNTCIGKQILPAKQQNFRVVLSQL